MTSFGRPILVTGAIRSGTTWVGRLLAAAPGVAYIHEPFNVDHPVGTFAHRWRHQYTYLTEETGIAGEVARAMADTLAFRYRPLVHLRRYDGPLRSLGAVRDLPRSWYRRLLAHPRPLLKDPIALFSAEWLARSFGMDVVIMVRHPGAFAWSYLRIAEPNRFPDLLAQPELMRGPLAPFADEVTRAARSDDPIFQAGTLWRIVYAVVDEYRERHPCWVITRHEDLSVDPFGEFPGLFARLGLPYTSRVQRLVQGTTSPVNPVEAPSGALHHLRRDSRRNTSVWRRRLSPEDILRLRTLTAGVADRFYGPFTWSQPHDDSPERLARVPGTPPTEPSSPRSE